MIGAAHAGWKGALGGVVEAAVRGDGNAWRAARAHPLRVGPCITQPSYEVGAEFSRAVRRSGCGERATISRRSTRAGHWQFDLPGYVAARLARLGLAAVDVIDRCTYEQRERLFLVSPDDASRRVRLWPQSFGDHARRHDSSSHYPLPLLSLCVTACAAITEPIGMQDPFAIPTPFQGVERNDGCWRS